eukprot:PhM_4_TR8378/c8_g3_i3/m.65960
MSHRQQQKQQQHQHNRTTTKKVSKRSRSLTSSSSYNSSSVSSPHRSQQQQQQNGFRMSNPVQLQNLCDMCAHIDPRLVEALYKFFGGNADVTAQQIFSVSSPSELETLLRNNNAHPDQMNEEDEGNNDESLQVMMSMGFDRLLCVAMLEHFEGNVDVVLSALLDGHIPAPVQAAYKRAQKKAQQGAADDGRPTKLITDPTRLLSELKEYEKVIVTSLDNETIFVQPPDAIPRHIRDDLIATYNEMMLRFADEKYAAKYGGSEDDMETCTELEVGGGVPAYYANCAGESMYTRKILSMAGLRNLVLHGVDIYCEFQAKAFSGRQDVYAPKTGLSKMKYFTGNTVDLDTVVLRCSEKAVLDTVNKLNKQSNAEYKEHYSSGDHFGKSAQARAMAIAAAEPLLESFCTHMKLTTVQQQSERCVQYREYANALKHGRAGAIKLPVATNNTDRGHAPLWQYVNCGVNSFHVNVPNMSDVVGALLRSPISAAVAYLLCRHDDDALDAFFEDAIADSCFNAKWKSLEEFNAGLAKKGRISNVLAELQKKYQKRFMDMYARPGQTDSDEVALVLELIGSSTVGTDKDGNVRPITRADVAAWVADPAVDL